jgi:hypothetical protein
MKGIKTPVLVVILIVLATFAVGIAAEAALMKRAKENNQIYIKNAPQPTLFDAEITFYVLTGEGCACDPIPGTLIEAYGGEGYVSGVTDEDGMCVLTLVILGEYEIYIKSEDYQEVYFEFNVLDDQTFTFHMFEKDESSTNTASLSHNSVINVLK